MSKNNFISNRKNHTYPSKELNHNEFHITMPEDNEPLEEDNLAEKTATFWIGPNLALDPGETIMQQVQPSESPSKISLKSYVMSNPGIEPNEDTDYELIEKLGKGGMGDVYLANQVSMDRNVAVKMIRKKNKINEEAKARFLSEAAVTGELDHPNIVPIHALGRNENGELFYSMKRVVGDPWSSTIDGNTREENLDILMRVADAIAFAHSRGVIHMDLKPDNVMLGQFGEVYVMDWGLAASVHESGKAKLITETDMIGGTPAYMAPEIAAGNTKKINTASDIYLLGAVLFKIVTGKAPHTGNDSSSCLVHAAENVIQDPGFDDAFLPIAYQAMAAKPKDRYKDVAAFQNAIRECRSHAESHSLTYQANFTLKEAQKTREYDLFAQSIYGFREALRHWEDNEKATNGISRAQYVFAEVAFERGDFDLALTLLKEEDKRHTMFREKVILEIEQRKMKIKRERIFNRLSKGLAASLFIILSTSIWWIYSEKQQVLQAEANARSALAQEQEAREEVEKLRLRLEEALGIQTSMLDNDVEEKGEVADEKAAPKVDAQFAQDSNQSNTIAIASNHRKQEKAQFKNKLNAQLENIRAPKAPVTEKPQEKQAEGSEKRSQHDSTWKGRQQDSPRKANEPTDNLVDELSALSKSGNFKGQREIVDSNADYGAGQTSNEEPIALSEIAESSALAVSVEKSLNKPTLSERKHAKYFGSIAAVTAKGKTYKENKKKRKQASPLKLLYRSALLQFDLGSAKRYAHALSKKSNSQELKNAGDNCIKDIEDLEKLLQIARNSINKKPRNKVLTLGNGHKISGHIRIGTRGKIRLMQSKNNVITKNILDLSYDTIYNTTKNYRGVSQEQARVLLALFTYASGDLKKAEEQFKSIAKNDPRSQHHIDMLSW